MRVESSPRCRACGSGAVRLRYRLSRYDIFACQDCTLWFREPLPDEAELKAMYEDPAYHASAYFEDASSGRPAPELVIYRRALRDLAQMTEGRTLLDVGAGTGTFLDLARGAGWDVRGVELSERHAVRARAHFALDIWQGDFLEAPVDEHRFDVVTMWDFLEHVLDLEAVLAKARRLLVPEGVLLVFTIDSTSLFNQVGGFLYQASRGRAVRPLELLYDFRHNYYFTRAALTALVERNGFHVERWRADRAHLGHWLSEPAPWYVFAGGVVLDLVSFAVGRPYRRTIYCRKNDEPVAAAR